MKKKIAKWVECGTFKKKNLDLREKFCSNCVTPGSTLSMFFSDSSGDDVLLSHGNSSLHLEESQTKLLTILVHLKDSLFFSSTRRHHESPTAVEHMLKT